MLLRSTISAGAVLCWMMAASGVRAAEEPLRPATNDRMKPDCHDDRMVDRCSPAQQKKVRDLYGLADVKALADQGVQLRPAFFVDGYGRDKPVVTFGRVPGAPPMMTVHSIWGDDVRTLQSNVPLELWNSILERSEYFDRTLLPAAPQRPTKAGGEEEVVMCLHSWVVTIEAADAPDGPIRSKTQDSCDEGLAVSYGFFLAEQAAKQLPPCRALDLRWFRNAVDLLQRCSALEGDTLAAAEAVNSYEELDFDYPPNADEARALFTYDTQVSWTGEPKAQGAEAAATLWLRKRSTAPRNGFYWERVIGDTADKVRIEGIMTYTREGTDFGAPTTLIWMRTGVGAFRLHSMTVGSFAPLPVEASSGPG